ncbi:hypothetical protein SAMN02745127_00501 [Oceanospirillum multiglobuliferum]|uniref:HNH nuclease domain-containing protein n=1 Tax=Oceanospirillum multiglobuliferum TaxID=64969 RepID=A0A1T4LJM0_9GAMM|nr:HNH endonuclease [Oceanospirillum multiglobuliferum]OPX56635.1 hypothetical protein BTE48_01670 [Oceanospirillum multiglobuliferum]SJZ54905.1 hypothetical protein SAMN02745127_00501 [Oceanospirillum multiglobuliferum]
MKLKADFSALWQNVKKMGEYEADFDIDMSSASDLKLDQELSSTAGLDITLDDLSTQNGVLSVRGRQVLLFIPDHGGNIEAVISGQNIGNRFHVADCSTLDKMRRQNRFDRYKATYNTSGKFEIFGTSYYGGSNRTAEVELAVCKNCLNYLNYNGYRQDRDRVFSKFSIAEFLSTYSTLFKSMPDRPAMIDEGGYSDDWSQISANYRRLKNYQCESCLVILTNNKGLLHTHHINGNKRQNSTDNLMSLCIDCHRKQPKHEYMRVKHNDMLQINKLRKEQGLIHNRNWTEVRKMADKAFEGLLYQYESAGKAMPVVHYDLMSSANEYITTLDLAWPKHKLGISVNDLATEKAKSLGWKVLSIGEALRA